MVKQARSPSGRGNRPVPAAVDRLRLGSPGRQITGGPRGRESAFVPAQGASESARETLREKHAPPSPMGCRPTTRCCGGARGMGQKLAGQGRCTPRFNRDRKGEMRNWF